MEKDHELDKVREDIERLVCEYCDGTYWGLEKAHFIEYNSNGKGPQDLLDDIIRYIDGLRGSSSTVESLPSKQNVKGSIPFSRSVSGSVSGSVSEPE